MRRKNIKDQLRSINYPGIDQLFDISLLRGGEIVIKQNEISSRGSCRPSNFLQLALTDQGCRIWPVAMLKNIAHDLRPRADCEIAQFVQRLFSAELRL